MGKQKTAYLKKHVIGTLRRWDVFTRLLIMFILAIFLPMIMTTVYSYRIGSRTIQEKVFLSVNEVVNQISGNVDKKIEKLKNDSIETSYMTEIQDLLMNYPEYTNQMLYNTEIRVTQQISSKYAMDNIVTEIILYTLDRERIRIYGYEMSAVNLSQDYLDGLLAECKKEDGKCVIRALNETCQDANVRTVIGDRSIIAAKAVKHKSSGEIIGYMILQVDESNFSDLYRSIDQRMDAQTVIMNGDNTVVSAVGTDATPGEPFPVRIADETMSDAGRYEPVSINGRKMVPVSRKSEENDWTVFFMIPEEYLQADLIEILFSFLGVCVVGLALGGLVVFLFSYSIVSPLNETIAGIAEFEKGNLEVTLGEDGNDEITKLDRQFNKMAREISNLMERVKRDEKQKRRLEIRALQAQVNPHFLANTLNTVGYLAKMKNDHTIETLVNAMIELLRFSMRNDGSMHTLASEMELIRNYITIQDYRLLGKFTVDIQVEPDILDCMIPRFILQPIVENAILHGIEPSSHRGVISIKGYQTDGQIRLVVTDNGVGMEGYFPEQEERKPENKKAKFSGIGVRNVDERIRLIYGEEYGLDIRSEKDFFTTVTIRMPLREKGGTENVQDTSGR